MSWYSKNRETLGKTYVGAIDDGRVKLFLVNGGYIRDNLTVDFVWGGHGYAYDFIPNNEIWVERHDTDEHDLIGILAHEIFEFMQMRDKGLKYEKAHALASKFEAKIRHLV